MRWTAGNVPVSAEWISALGVRFLLRWGKEDGGFIGAWRRKSIPMGTRPGETAQRIRRCRLSQLAPQHDFARNRRRARQDHGSDSVFARLGGGPLCGSHPRAMEQRES